MATRTWTGGTGAWQTASNWDNGAYAFPPQAGDDVKLPSSASAYVVTLDASATGLGSLTLGDYTHTNSVVLVVANNASLSTTGAISIANYAVIEGAGTITAGGGFDIVWAGTGNPSILAGTSTTGGMLELVGSIAYNINLGFANSTFATTLKLDSSNSLSYIAIKASSQTLEIGAGANVSFSTVENVVGGTIKLDGATLTASSGVVLILGATLTGSGTLAGGINGNGSIISAAGGTLTLTANVGDNTAAATNLVIGDGSSLYLTSAYGIGSSGVGPTLTFQGNGDLFQAVNIDLYNVYLGTISGFSGTDLIKLASYGSGDTLSYNASAHTVTISQAGGYNSHTFTFSASTDVSQIALNQSVIGGKTVDVLSICFMPGTLLRTPDGESAIETLKIGDRVLTADGDAKPIRWIGRQTILTRFADPLRNLPIRIQAGALGDNVPSRDLLVSPDHALLIEGALVHAGALVNELTILRETRVPEKFVYYHVELDDHALALAENVPAETFVDNADRRHFDNWVEHEALFPQGRSVAELDLPRVKSARQLPDGVRRLVAARAEILGRADAA